MSAQNAYVLLIKRQELWRGRTPWGYRAVPSEEVITIVARELGCSVEYLTRAAQRAIKGIQWPRDDSGRPLPFLEVPVYLTNVSPSAFCEGDYDKLVVGNHRVPWPEPETSS